MKSFHKKLLKFEFIRYVLVGGLATIIDWMVFYILVILLGLYYQFSLVISFSLGATTNYAFNKIFTFKCKSRKIISQFSLFSVIAVISLLLSMFLMFFLVDIILLEKMLSRILTTVIMLIINYSMNKYITFNKRLFK